MLFCYIKFIENACLVWIIRSKQPFLIKDKSVSCECFVGLTSRTVKKRSQDVMSRPCREFTEADYIQFKASMAKGGLTKSLLDVVNLNDGVDRARLMVEAVINDRYHPETLKWWYKFAAEEYPKPLENNMDWAVFRSSLFDASPGQFMEFMRRLRTARFDVRMMCLVNSCPDRLPSLMVQVLKCDPYVISLETEAALRAEAQRMSYESWSLTGVDGGSHLSVEECYQDLKKQRGM